jgi:choline dehydrogenase-like flavoprotein
MPSTRVKDFDVVIVGSGAGGGTVAARLAPLARAGMKIAVLESGPRLKETEFTGREVEMAERLYYEGGGFLTKDRTMTLAMGNAFGGSTVVYTGTSIKIAKKTVERWNVPGLDWDDLSRRSDRCAAENGVHTLPDERLNDNNTLFRDACRRLGWRVAQFPVNVRDCRGAGLCNLGCPNGAKQGTHRVQLPAAESAGVAMIPNCRVERIAERAVEAVVSPAPFGEEAPWPPGRYRVRAKLVVLAAGAVHTPALLLRSGFGERLRELGNWFTAHPAMIVAGRHKAPITNYQGHPKSFYCEEFAERGRFLLETCMYFPFTTAKNLPGFGREHEAMASAMDRLQMILVLALDPARRSNRVGIDRQGRVFVDYRIGDDVLDSLFAGVCKAGDVLGESGCERVAIPGDRRRDRFLLGEISVSAAHLMGGCRMGTGPSDSVCDSWGRVHGLPWLRVADASLFPQAAGINPYLTIMALADRAAEAAARDLREERVVAGGSA